MRSLPRTESTHSIGPVLNFNDTGDTHWLKTILNTHCCGLSDSNTAVLYVYGTSLDPVLTVASSATIVSLDRRKELLRW